MWLRMTVFLILPLFLTGCSDDSTEPEAFALTVQVVDREGEPVQGLRASLSPDIEGVLWPHGDKDGRPTTEIRLDLPGASSFVLEILAVDGELVWETAGESMPPGTHGIAWDATDIQGHRVHDGYYEAVITIDPDDEDEPTQVVEHPLLLISGSPEDFVVATTDAAGRFVVSDRTFVPAFWDLMPMYQYDELGEIVGELDITTATRLVLIDEAGHALTRVFDAVDEPQELQLEWPY